MSKDIIVLTPNGRRQKVHCTPNTSMLQVLEDVCQKQGFQPAEYDLKHHNHILDLTSTVRFSNLPNKATLEMVEAERKREETNVTIGLLLEDGKSVFSERRTADFSPNTSLFDLITSLAPVEFTSLRQPTIMYMRQEVTGEPALRSKTLRQLGLFSGRAILRLLNKAEEAKQANVSSVYRKPSQPEPEIQIVNDHAKTKPGSQPQTLRIDDAAIPGPSTQHKNIDHSNFDPIKAIREEKHAPTEKPTQSVSEEDTTIDEETIMDVDQSEPVHPHPNSTFTQENLERRLNIEEEVTFLGEQKSIAFMRPESSIEELDDLPDDFYDLSIDEVRRLYKDLHQHRLELENTPLTVSSKREELEAQTSQQRMSLYKNVVVRVQFPDHIILQGIFVPTNTIQDVTNFIKEHLQHPEKPFHIFTTPLKDTLDPKVTLLDAKFVPCVHMHFKWLEESGGQKYLKEEIYSKQTSSDAASILASKYRAPSRRKMDSVPGTSHNANTASTSSKSSKLPKWFKK